MTKALKHITLADLNPPFFLGWMPFREAVLHVVAYAVREGKDAESEVGLLKDIVAERAIASIWCGDILHEEEAGELTWEGLNRLVAVDIGSWLSRGWPIDFSDAANCDVFLSRWQVYRQWEYSDRQKREARLERRGGPISAYRNKEERELAEIARQIWAAKRAAWESIMGGRPDAPPMPADLEAPPAAFQPPPTSTELPEAQKPLGRLLKGHSRRKTKDAVRSLCRNGYKYGGMKDLLKTINEPPYNAATTGGTLKRAVAELKTSKDPVDQEVQLWFSSGSEK
jgi:hypothetical protein